MAPVGSPLGNGALCRTRQLCPGATTSSSDTDSLEEVVVTAERREERLQDVPISISAFSQEKMDTQGLRDIDDLTS